MRRAAKFFGPAGGWRKWPTFVFGRVFSLHLREALDAKMERGGEQNAVQLQDQGTR